MQVSLPLSSRSLFDLETKLIPLFSTEQTELNELLNVALQKSESLFFLILKYNSRLSDNQFISSTRSSYDLNVCVFKKINTRRI